MGADGLESADMDVDYQALHLEYRRSPEQVGGTQLHPVVVIGAGPVGLCAALDLAQRGVPIVLLDDDNRLSHGSRAICFAKRTLEIFDRLACGQRVVDKGVCWHVGKVFFQDGLAYSFDLLPEEGSQRPAFVNLQQYYVEGYLLEQAQQLSHLDIRWQHKLIGLEQHDDHVTLTVETPEGNYALQARYVIAADGSRSSTRAMLGLDSKGQVFKDRFLIADVKMEADFPSERWFWFDPPFHPGKSALLHRQPDNVWRIDFQLGWDTDPAIEKLPERVIPRVQALLGKDAKFELEWVSVYTFACQRMEKFRHGRVLYAGDAAHLVSPFGARGANSGIQDADNLAWKLALVLAGKAPDGLLDSYAQERERAADENIRHSSRSTDFITPKSAVSRLFRDAVLRLAADHPFARRLVNSGRLSTPTVLQGSALNSADEGAFSDVMEPGAACADAPVLLGQAACRLLPHLGQDFTVMLFCSEGGPDAATEAHWRTLQGASVPLKLVVVAPPNSNFSVDHLPCATLLHDVEGRARQPYDACAGTVYLLRPDQHVAARLRSFDAGKLRLALERALGKNIS